MHPRRRHLVLAVAVFVVALAVAGVLRRVLDPPTTEPLTRADFVASCVEAGGEVVPGVCGCAYDALFALDDGRSLAAYTDSLDQAGAALPEEAATIIEGCVIAARGATGTTAPPPTKDET